LLLDASQSETILNPGVEDRCMQEKINEDMQMIWDLMLHFNNISAGAKQEMYKYPSEESEKKH
jgi:hypothetical protein